MARIMVTTDPRPGNAAPVLMDESIYSIHLDSGHDAGQLIERLVWAIGDAEELERSESVELSRSR